MTTAAVADVNVGQVVVVTVPYVNESGLRDESTLQFMVREAHAALWNVLDASSCLVDGPSGSGKSTAVWLWLIRRVHRTGNTALWVHFAKRGGMLAVVIKRTEEGGLEFRKVLEKDPFRDHEVQAVRVCVVDGVTAANKHKADESWLAFGLDFTVYKNCHMIWVSSQQLVIPGEHLEVVKMESHRCFSWGKDEIIAYAATFDDETRGKYVEDIVSALPSRRRTPGESFDFDQAIAIKMHYCGCSARWMFGMSMKEALEDIDLHLSKVQDAKLIRAGLSGARGLTAVNHIIATYESDDPERASGLFSIASNYIMERVSETVGLEAIRVMYSSHWVNKNPAVHGFVFEWDILTRLEKFKSLTLTDMNGSSITWSITQSVRLSEVFNHGITADKTLVYPEKWNHPEFDGLYIHNVNGYLHLVAWNASEASTHSGSVSNLVVFLESLSQREAGSIDFVNVRFLFLVPVQTLASFKMPSDSQRLLARQQLQAWSFTDFEVYGTRRTLT